jgi:phosphatidylinositol glycan class O
LDGGEIGQDSLRAFDSINQIDLVPTISMLLGLPIPYANIGGLVPELLPGSRIASSSSSTPHAAVALALNAAQVWTYFNDYSKKSRDLPMDQLKELKDLLDSATAVYKDALAQAKNHARKKKGSESVPTAEDKEENAADYNDSIAFRQVCSLYKLFLAESTDLGKRVWTQFNEGGMIIGIGVLALACIVAFPLWRKEVRTEIRRVLSNESFSDYDAYKGGGSSKGHEKDFVNRTSKTCDLAIRSFRIAELATAFIFMTFHCGVLTFGNSYIENERDVVTFFLSSLCFLIFCRLYNVSSLGHSPLRDRSAYVPLAVAFCARLNDIFVTGHGLDPSIRLHPAHHALVFSSSLMALVFLRIVWLDGPWYTETAKISSNSLSVWVDVVAITCLALSWWEKRSRDHSRNGFYMARLSIILTLSGLLLSAYNMLLPRSKTKEAPSHDGEGREKINSVHQSQLALYRVMMFIVIVTGPSTASTGVLVIIQTAALCRMMESSGAKEVSPNALYVSQFLLISL